MPPRERLAMATAQAWMVLNTDPGGDGGLFSYAISIALAYPMSSVCHTMKRERNVNH